MWGVILPCSANRDKVEAKRYGALRIHGMIVESKAFREEGMVVFCAANCWSGILLADQHMAIELSKRVPVVYVDPPVSPLKLWKESGVPRPRLCNLNERLIRFTPVRPPKGFSRPFLRTSELSVRYQLARYLGSVGSPLHAVISAWPLINPLGALREARSVYWAQDDYSGIVKYLGGSKSLLEQSEIRVAKSSNRLVTSSPAVQASWQRRGYSPTMIPFGCPPQPPRLDLQLEIRVKHPRAVFVGHINSRIDLPILEELTHRGVSLVFIGPRDPAREDKRLTSLLSRPGVQWVGAVDFGTLPAYLSHMDLGLVPYDVTDSFNRGSFPLKTLEYLSAGLPVVSTPLPASLWLDTDLITIAEGPLRYADHVQSLLAKGSTPELVHRRKQFADKHSWRKRIDQWIPLLCHD